MDRFTTTGQEIPNSRLGRKYVDNPMQTPTSAIGYKTSNTLPVVREGDKCFRCKATLIAITNDGGTLRKCIVCGSRYHCPTCGVK